MRDNPLRLLAYGPTIWGDRNAPHKKYQIAIVPMDAVSGVPHGCRIELGQSARTLFLTEADRIRLGLFLLTGQTPERIFSRQRSLPETVDPRGPKGK